METYPFTIYGEPSFWRPVPHDPLEPNQLHAHDFAEASPEWMRKWYGPDMNPDVKRKCDEVLHRKRMVSYVGMEEVRRMNNLRHGDDDEDDDEDEDSSILSGEEEGVLEMEEKEPNENAEPVQSQTNTTEEATQTRQETPQDIYTRVRSEVDRVLEQIRRDDNVREEVIQRLHVVNVKYVYLPFNFSTQEMVQFETPTREDIVIDREVYSDKWPGGNHTFYIPQGTKAILFDKNQSHATCLNVGEVEEHEDGYHLFNMTTYVISDPSAFIYLECVRELTGGGFTALHLQAMSLHDTPKHTTSRSHIEWDWNDGGKFHLEGVSVNELRHFLYAKQGWDIAAVGASDEILSDVWNICIHSSILRKWGETFLAPWELQNMTHGKSLSLLNNLIVLSLFMTDEVYFCRDLHMFRLLRVNVVLREAHRRFSFPEDFAVPPTGNLDTPWFNLCNITGAYMREGYSWMRSVKFCHRGSHLNQERTDHVHHTCDSICSPYRHIAELLQIPQVVFPQFPRVRHEGIRGHTRELVEWAEIPTVVCPHSDIYSLYGSYMRARERMASRVGVQFQNSPIVGRPRTPVPNESVRLGQEGQYIQYVDRQTYTHLNTIRPVPNLVHVSRAIPTRRPWVMNFERSLEEVKYEEGKNDDLRCTICLEGWIGRSFNFLFKACRRCENYMCDGCVQAYIRNRHSNGKCAICNLSYEDMDTYEATRSATQPLTQMVSDTFSAEDDESIRTLALMISTTIAYLTGSELTRNDDG